VSDLLMEQVELYRDTRESIAQARRPGAARLLAGSPRRPAPRPATRQRRAVPTRLAAQLRRRMQLHQTLLVPRGGTAHWWLRRFGRPKAELHPAPARWGVRRPRRAQGDLDSWRAMPLAARERALQAEMRTEGNLHPALFPPSADPSSLLGHYRVRPAALIGGRTRARPAAAPVACGAIAESTASLTPPRVACGRASRRSAVRGGVTGARRAQVLRHISEGLVAFLLERHDHAKPLIRSVARELLCSCALRSAILFFNPYSLNRVRALP